MATTHDFGFVIVLLIVAALLRPRRRYPDAIEARSWVSRPELAP
jgi:hypothetical protein